MFITFDLKFDSYTIIAKKSGYRNYSLHIEDTKKTRFQINLEEGNDITIQTLLSETGQTTKLKNSKIYINKKLAGKTDNQGLFVKTLQNELGDIIDLKIVPSEKYLTSFETSIVYSSAINIKKTFYKSETPKIDIDVLQASITGKNSNLNLDKEYDKFLKTLAGITKGKSYL